MACLSPAGATLLGAHGLSDNAISRVARISYEGFALWQGHLRAQAGSGAGGCPYRAHSVQLWQTTGRVTQWQAHAGGADILHLVPNRPILLHRRRAAVARSPIQAIDKQRRYAAI